MTILMLASFSTIAGRNTYEFYDPQRKTPIHNWHYHKAVFEDVGQWKRPWYFKKFETESMHLAVGVRANRKTQDLRWEYSWKNRN